MIITDLVNHEAYKASTLFDNGLPKAAEAKLLAIRQELYEATKLVDRLESIYCIPSTKW